MKHKALFIIAGLFIISLPLFAQKADTLQPGPEGKDAFIDEWIPDQNYGYQIDLWTGKAGMGTLRYSFIEFDLSSYSGKTLDSCFLDLYCYKLEKTAGYTDTTGIWEVGEPWDEASITWNNQPRIADFSHISFYIGTDSLIWWIWNVKDFVQDWLDGTNTNYGFCVGFLSGGGADSYATFASSDTSLPDIRPKLRLYLQEQKSITVTSPNGGEDWQVGSKHDITWTTTGSIDSVTIDLFDQDRLEETIVSSARNTGTYSWTIPNKPGDYYTILVSDVSDYYNVQDASDDYFTISEKPPTKSITVISPNGGEKWKVGSTQEIKWSWTGQIDSVVIEYGNEVVWPLDTIAVVPNTGSYSWTIPNTPGDSTIVAVSDVSDYNNVWDTNDAFFTISPASSLVEHQNREAGRLWLEVHTSPSAQPIIRYQVPVPSKASLKIYAIDGRIVRDLTSQVTANSGNLVWDGCDDSNKPVPTGIYFCQLKTAEKQATQKVMLIR